MNIREKYNVRNCGKGDKNLIFANGYGCNQTMWNFIIPELEGSFNMHFYDHMGTGLSNKEFYSLEKYSNLDGYAEDLNEVIQELNLFPITLVAHSVSCMVGVLSSIKNPSLFDRIIMIGPSPHYQNDGLYNGGFSSTDIDELLMSIEENYLGWATGITPIIMGNPDKPELAEQLKNVFCEIEPRIALNFAEATFRADNRSDLKKVTVPVDIIQCDQDEIAPLSVGKYVEKSIPNAKLHIISENGHCPHVSSPKVVAEIIKVILS